MWIRIAQKYNFDFVANPLFKYYIHYRNFSKILNLETEKKDIESIFEKYKNYYLKNPKIYSIKLRNDGTRHILTQKLQRGRKCFLKSVKVNPLNFKSYFYFIFSFFGFKFYYKLTLIKAKLKGIISLIKFNNITI